MNVDKRVLRKEVRTRLTLLSASCREEYSARICRTLKELLVRHDAKVVALFSPLADEPQIWPLVEEISETKLVVLPRVEGENMQFYPYHGRVAQGAYGIMEPLACGAVEPCEIDVMVVPGVVFTRNGERMGRGKGYYDKYMSREGFRAFRIGVCYPVQLVGSIPLEEHDVRMDSLVYE